MFRDGSDEEDRPNGSDRPKKHKKEKHRVREKDKTRYRSPEEGLRDRSSHRLDKVSS